MGVPASSQDLGAARNGAGGAQSRGKTKPTAPKAKAKVVPKAKGAGKAKAKPKAVKKGDKARKKPKAVAKKAAKKPQTEVEPQEEGEEEPMEEDVEVDVPVMKRPSARKAPSVHSAADTVPYTKPEPPRKKKAPVEELPSVEGPGSRQTHDSVPEPPALPDAPPDVKESTPAESQPSHSPEGHDAPVIEPSSALKRQRTTDESQWFLEAVHFHCAGPVSMQKNLIKIHIGA